MTRYVQLYQWSGGNASDCGAKCPRCDSRYWQWFVWLLFCIFVLVFLHFFVQTTNIFNSICNNNLFSVLNVRLYDLFISYFVNISHNYTWLSNRWNHNITPKHFVKFIKIVHMIIMYRLNGWLPTTVYIQIWTAIKSRHLFYSAEKRNNISEINTSIYTHFRR